MQMDKILIKACQNGQKGIVESFLKRNNMNINHVDNDGYAALHYACAKGTRDIVKMLIAHGADVSLASNKGVTPLHLAAKTGSKEIIKMLVDEGADINVTDDSGESVIIYGIKSGRTDAVRFMKELGADVTLADNEGRTAVDHANIKGMAGMIENVLDGAEIHADSFGNTPLHQSCYNGHSEAVKAMLRNQDIEVDVKNDAGETPLICAIKSKGVQKGSVDIVELLLEYNADVDCTDIWGNSALYYATECGSNAIIEMLLEAGVANE